jgi:23S rRNA pseudouridine955/2504/2580 synthase
LQIKINQSFNRLDKFLYQYFESIPLSLIQRLIRQYKIKINNKKSKANSDLKIGDIIFIYYNFEFQNSKNLTIKISEDLKKLLRKNVIFENYDFVIINKIRGYSVQRGSKVKISLKDYYESTLGYPLYIVHRLDKDTSGLMIFAKTRLAASGISKLFLTNKIHKYYLAKTHKSFNKKSDMLENVNNEKKTLKLFYRKISPSKDEHFYLIKLLTGRKHQIRLQFFLNNNPIIGDKKFSQDKNKKLLLCAVSIHFYYLNKFYKFKLNLNQIDQ